MLLNVTQGLGLGRILGNYQIYRKLVQQSCTDPCCSQTRILLKHSMLTIPPQTLERNTCCFLSAFSFKMLMMWKNLMNITGRWVKEESKKGSIKIGKNNFSVIWWYKVLHTVCFLVCLFIYTYLYVCFWRYSPPVGQILLIHEVSRSNTTTHRIR